MKTRFQFRIATLLWLTVCVASFFAGRHWDEIAKAVSPQPRVLFNAQLQIVAGRTASVESNMPVTRMMVADPTIATVTLVSPSILSVTAKRLGTTKIQLWSQTTNQTATYDVTVK